jgi:galactokinase
MTISVPGRTELAGNHTDHQGGHVLAAAVDLLVQGNVEPKKDDRVVLTSDGYGQIQVDLRYLDSHFSKPGTAEALVRGVLDYLNKEGYPLHGFEAKIRSDIPAGAGLSSSAAFSVWVGKAVQSLYRTEDVSPMTLALAARYAENVHFGKPCGLMDQCACAFGGITAMSFRKDRPVVHRIAIDPTTLGYALYVVQTGGDHRDLTEDYAQITREMGKVAGFFGADRLCEVSPQDILISIPELRRTAGDRAVLRALHYVEEDKRAQEMARALECRDMNTYLAYMDASGRSSAELLQNSFSPSDPQNQGISLALALSRKVLGNNGAARVHGGGFAGTIQALMPPEFEKKYCSELEAVFGLGSCRKLRIWDSSSSEMSSAF